MANVGKEQETRDNNQNVGRAMEKFSHNVGSDLGAVAKEVSAKASNYVKTTRQYVEANPLKSVGIAAATGIALGSLLSMTRRKH